MGSRRALFIAPLYDGQFVAHLPGAPLVEQRLAKALRDFGGYDFRAVRGSVTRPSFRKAIGELVDTTCEILFFFYGHGVVRDGTTGIFVTSDGAPYDEGVSMSEILQAGFGSKAREAVFILDCCHAGASMGVDGEALGALAERTLRPGRVLIAGCAGHQQGWVGDQEGRKLGVFSWHALQGLEGKARPPPKHGCSRKLAWDIHNRSVPILEPDACIYASGNRGSTLYYNVRFFDRILCRTSVR